MNKTAEIITNQFLEAIKTTGKLPWTKPWRTVNVRNATTGKDYNGINTLMLSMFGKDTDFLTFNQAKDNGGIVKAGSKGLRVCFFKFMDKKDVAGNAVMRNGKVSKWPLLRYSTVFNLSDIDGCEALKAKADARKKQIDFTPIEACDKLVDCYSIATNHGANRASYSPAIHAINMPARESFASVNHYYATIFHELGHALAKELGEDISNGFGDDAYSKEELVAELFANFCLSYSGIDSGDLFNNSLAYLQGWTSKLTSDPTILISAASKASKRFNLLLTKAGLLSPVVEESEETEQIEVVAA